MSKRIDIAMLKDAARFGNDTPLHATLDSRSGTAILMRFADSFKRGTTMSTPVETRPATERNLPSGRSVVVRVDGGKEELEVRSPNGDVEVRITLTDAGPVVSVRGARLELESPDAVSVNCRR